MSVYSIRGWTERFENSESRKRPGALKWVGVPIDFEDRTFRAIARHPRGSEIYTAYMLMVQVAARSTLADHPKQVVRGWLVHPDGSPVTIDDLADLTRFPAEIFQLAIDVLAGDPYRWIDINAPVPAGVPADDGDKKPVDPVAAGEAGNDFPLPPVATADDGNEILPDAGAAENSGKKSPPTITKTLTVTDTYPPSAGACEPDPAVIELEPVTPPVAKARQLAVEAFERWSNIRPPVGRGYPLDYGIGEPLKIHALVNSLAELPPVIHAGEQVSRHLLVPQAIEMLIKRDRPFKAIGWAIGIVKSELAEWGQHGIRPAKSSENPGKAKAEAAKARMAKALQEVGR